MNQTETAKEAISALADGHLNGVDFANTVARVCADPDAREVWQTYQVVGDFLRSEHLAPCSDTNQFLNRFQQRLAAEPTVQRPVVTATVATVPAEAANEPVFRWKLVAGAASLAAAAAIGWTWIGSGASSSIAGAQLAQQTESPSVLASSARGPDGAVRSLSSRVAVGAGQPQIMLRDPRLDQLLDAHRQAGGIGQMPSSFLRNATFEGASR